MTYKVELGWMTITPCSKVEWTPTDIPGIKTPTVVFAEQRLHAYAVFETSGEITSDVQQSIKDCALLSIGAAGGVGAITANPGAAVAAFQEAFLACFAAKFPEVAINAVHLDTSSECMW